MMDNMYTGYKKNINRSEVREQICCCQRIL